MKDEFSEQFKQLTAHWPFPWQKILYERFTKGVDAIPGTARPCRCSTSRRFICRSAWADAKTRRVLTADGFPPSVPFPARTRSAPAGIVALVSWRRLSRIERWRLSARGVGAGFCGVRVINSIGRTRFRFLGVLTF